MYETEGDVVHGRGMGGGGSNTTAGEERKKEIGWNVKNDEGSCEAQERNRAGVVSPRQNNSHELY